jgi:UDP-N-acetyl-D-mannosaminuronic acid dehydrogenase
MFKFDVGIVGGCGHVGLPLGLLLAEKGLKVLAIDINKDSVDKVMNKKMPFLEQNAQKILEEVIDNGLFSCTTDESKINETEHIMIVPGTPIDYDFLPDMSQIDKIIKNIIPNLEKNHVLIFRSTLAPKSMDYIKNLIESNNNFTLGKDLFLAFAPERITQSKAIVELEKLPQIIGVNDDSTYEKVAKLFRLLGIETIKTTPLEAELAKLFTNNYRYVNFALANEFYMIAESLGANIYNVINAANLDYPRSKIPGPGFAKGPCLGKDAWILLSSVPNFSTFTGVISSSFKVNEGLPAFLVNEIKKRRNLEKSKIGVLGLTFKKDCDDKRDSLSLKLIKILKNEFVEFDTHDPYIDKKDLKEMLKETDIVIIAINHSLYEKTKLKKLVKKGTLIVDLWNTQKQGKTFFTV